MKVLNLINARKPFLMEQIRAVEATGVECDTICVPGDFYADDSDFTSRSVWDYVKFYPMVLSQVSSEYDVIHAHYGLTAPFALAQPHRPVVLSLWGRDLFGPASGVTKVCARLCDEVIVRSEEMKNELGRDAHIVERGVDIEKFKPQDQEEAQKEVGWEKDSKHVLFPYSPKREKKNYPLAEDVVHSVDENRDEGVVLHAVHNQPHEKIPAYMNAADVLLMTSRPKSEGSPNTVKEALACNLPVVSTPVGDVNELLDGVSNSFVCQSEEELSRRTLEILERGERSNGAEKVATLTWDNTSNQLLSIYESAIIS
ncbi:glycosyltransferase [Natronomonas salina]|uniref:glycosyltransferase n=1 Tax=Natronomonas salina TaxID=1710540 RepID=UPI0015B5AF7C|nr:glycosyltransferase [Natronomonas salina]QLD88781.1 glycosyltransferase [Natronomonas salina]